jgi:hypothetical protein
VCNNDAYYNIIAVPYYIMPTWLNVFASRRGCSSAPLRLWQFIFSSSRRHITTAAVYFIAPVDQSISTLSIDVISVGTTLLCAFHRGIQYLSKKPVSVCIHVRASYAFITFRNRIIILFSTVDHVIQPSRPGPHFSSSSSQR